MMKKYIYIHASTSAYLWSKEYFKSMCNSVNDYKAGSCCEHIYMKTMHFEIVCFINISLQDSNI